MMRFKTDENIHPEVAAVLRQHGHDALTVWDQGLRGSRDEHIQEVCRMEKRILITMDLDFADVRTMPADSSTGTVIFRLVRQDRASVLGAIERVIPLVEHQPLFQHLWVVDETRVRIRGPAAPKT
jgi:predicted nuclease of predicted toxin-antitoxin system